MRHLLGKRGIRAIVLATATLGAASHGAGCTGDGPVIAAGGDAGTTSPSTDGAPPADGATGTDAAVTDSGAAADSGATDSGAAADSGAGDSGAGDSGVPDADAAASVNDCVTFVDRSAGSRTLTWDLGVASLPEHCMLIHVGQAVTWSGDFGFHPIGPHGGDVPTPVTAVSSGVTDTVTFLSAGTYGYQCSVHGFMSGAIKVE